MILDHPPVGSCAVARCGGNIDAATSFTWEMVAAAARPLPVGSCAVAMPARVRCDSGPAATSFPSEVMEASPVPKCGQVLRELWGLDRHRGFWRSRALARRRSGGLLTRLHSGMVVHPPLLTVMPAVVGTTREQPWSPRSRHAGKDHGRRTPSVWWNDYEEIVDGKATSNWYMVSISIGTGVPNAISLGPDSFDTCTQT
jgi:hypothetical protein